MKRIAVCLAFLGHLSSAHAVASSGNYEEAVESKIIKNFANHFFQNLYGASNIEFDSRGNNYLWGAINRSRQLLGYQYNIGAPIQGVSYYLNAQGDLNGFIKSSFEVLSGHLDEKDYGPLLYALTLAIRKQYGINGLRMVNEELIPLLKKTLDINQESIQVMEEQILQPLGTFPFMKKAMTLREWRRAKNILNLETQLLRRIGSGKITLNQQAAATCTQLLERLMPGSIDRY